MVAGVAAAPKGFLPDAWLDLVAPPDAAELRDHLRRLKERSPLRVRPSRRSRERLAALRKVLAERGVDGCVLPLTDEHHSEYLPPAAQRLTWLTGFTGSAGLADRAGGARRAVRRWPLHAPGQGRARPRAVRALPRHRAAAGEVARASSFAAGQRLGFDPRLHTKAEVERYRAACAKAGAELVALDGQPGRCGLDHAGRPPPVAPIAVMDEAYAGEASAAKRARMAEAARKAGAEVLVVSATDSIAWLLNLRGGDVPFNPLLLSFALLHADGGGRAVHRPAQARARPEPRQRGLAAADRGLRRRARPAGRGRRAVLVDPRVTSLGVLERLRDGRRPGDRGGGARILAKACKNPVELKGARDAQRRDGAAVCRFLCWLEAELGRRPVDERAAAARLELRAPRRTRCSAARASRRSRPPARTPRCRTTA